MAITAQDVKTLRDRTGAGMANCKKALEEANGDFEAAIDILRANGAATAAKRADKAANEGLVATAVGDDRHSAAIVEVNCETDFVARNEEFSGFARSVAKHVLATRPVSMDALMSSEMDGKSVQNWLNELLGKFSERIEIKRFEVVETSGGFVADYVHNGDKLAVLIEMTGGEGNDKVGSTARDIAMQVAAMNPEFVNRTEVPQSVLDRERDILLEQIRNEGKNPEFADRIITGRIEKFYENACLIEQTFVKDSSRRVSDVLADLGREVGGDVSVARFTRYNLGEQASN